MSNLPLPTGRGERAKAVRNVWAAASLPPPPPKFARTRPHQAIAIAEIIEAFEDYDYVFLNAPTGSGKTWIGERTRRLMHALDHPGAIYMCSDLSLQDQFLNDFPYAKVLRGKANYATELGPTTGMGAVTCADCTLNSGTLGAGGKAACAWCNGPETCPYLKARREAELSPLAVLNTAYYLAEANTGAKFSGRDLVIIDECDMLEGALLGYVELRLGPKTIERFGMSAPDKGARRPTLVNWLEDFAQRVSDHASANRDSMKQRQIDDLFRMAFDCKRVAGELRGTGDEDDGDGERVGKWVRDYNDFGAGALVLKPIMVDGYANRYLWQHGRKHLLMSASIISADEMATSLGIEEGSYAVVDVPSTFPAENRPIIFVPVMSVTYKERANHIDKLGPAIVRILHAHPDERVLIHCVSYSLAKGLHDYVSNAFYQEGIMRPLHTYGERGRKAEALDDYLRQPASVMFAPSMDRGVDLPDDACRVQIVAKVPYLALGDRQVSERMHSPGGQLWYTVQNIRTLVQMVGRGVRHKDDTCTTYVLDTEFSKQIRKNRSLFPSWFMEAVDFSADIRWVLR